jgi:hypothetical protein
VTEGKGERTKQLRSTPSTSNPEAVEKSLVVALPRGLYRIRDMRVMLDEDVAEAFGKETKRVNEAVTNNPAKFSEAHSFVLSTREFEVLRSISSTSNTGRGGRRYPPRAFTLKGVARLATVMDTDEALRATDMIIDTWVMVYEQIEAGSELIRIPQPSRYKSSPELRQSIITFRERLIKALNQLLDKVVDVQTRETVSEAAQNFLSQGLQNVRERLRREGLENAKLEADTTLVLAQAEKTLAEAKLTQEDINDRKLERLRKSIQTVRELLATARDLEPAQFLDLADRYETPDERAGLPPPPTKDGSE